MNFECLPEAPNTLAIWGQGNAAELLHKVPWLAGCDVHYWGGIDEHGFQILNRFRSKFPGIRSVMMAVATLKKYRHLTGVGEKASKPPGNLTAEEQKAYDVVARMSSRGKTCAWSRRKSRNRLLEILSRLSTKPFLYCLHDISVLLFISDMKDYAIKTPQQLGAVLEGYRKNRGLTQKDVGSKVGLAQSVVSLLEKSPQRAGLPRIFKLLAALDLEIVVRPRGTHSRKSEW